MSYNHEAIYQVHTNAVRIDDSLGVFDAEGNKIDIDIDRVNAAAAEINAAKIVAYTKERRRQDYIIESDPLFFKYQRGEIEKSVWEAKVAEIKSRTYT
tara:strand:+ start:2527 stop:2820 length:294 start_codon:yes stop_codon:yes gene_type:complete